MEDLHEKEEKLVIRNFLSIGHAEIQLSQITAIIGPQASGKSLVAKAFFFFRSYLQELFFQAVELGVDKRTFDKEQRERFVELFHIEGGTSKSYSIEYMSMGISIRVECEAGGKHLKLKTSESLSKLFGKMKIDFARYKQRAEEDEKFRRRYDIYRFFEEYPSKVGNAQNNPRTLLVPASRSFFSTIRQEVFTLLTAQKTLDPVIAQFGRFYEIAKRRFESKRPLRTIDYTTIEEFQDSSRNLLKGEFLRKESRDWLSTDWGVIELPHSSSGQQEALPLLMSLAFYPTTFFTDELLIIEEPEAHLFPSAQKGIIDFAVNMSTRSNCKILFTSHSPYILACLNNHLAREKSIKSFINAYFMSKGQSKELFDQDQGVLDFGALDAVSEEISREFFKIINE